MGILSIDSLCILQVLIGILPMLYRSLEEESSKRIAIETDQQFAQARLEDIRALLVTSTPSSSFVLIEYLQTWDCKVTELPTYLQRRGRNLEAIPKGLATIGL